MSPTSSGDRHVRIEGRLGNDDDPDVEWSAFGFIYALGLLSFHDRVPAACPRFTFRSETAGRWPIMLRHLRYERGSLSFETDYLRGRMMKTSLTIRRDGSFSLDTINRGEAATRWISRLHGKKVLVSVESRNRMV